MERYFVKRVDVSKYTGTVLTTYNGKKDFCLTDTSDMKVYYVADYGFATIAAAKRTGHYKTWYDPKHSCYKTTEIKIFKAVVGHDWKVTMTEVQDG